MRILIATCGSRGDQEPVLQLARRLDERGHRVTLGGPEELQGPAARSGVRFAQAAVSMLPLMRAPGVVTGTPTESQLERVRSFLRENLELQLRTLSALSTDADVLLGTSLIHAGSSVAAAAAKPFLRIHFSPNAFPSASYSPPGAAGHQAAAARATAWNEYGARFDGVLLPTLNRYRREHGLAEASGLLSLGRTETVLLACDFALGPAPAERGPFTPRRVTQTGYWHGAVAGELDPALLRWFDALPHAPLYAGLGSVPAPDWPALVRGLLVLCHELDRPLLLCGSDPAVLAEVRASVDEAAAAWSAQRAQIVREAPHARLFPRCWAVLHHGGAGTVASAARAGVPQLVLPQARGSDQRLWSSRIEELGIGAGADGDGAVAEASLRELLSRVQREHPRMLARAGHVRRALEAADTRAAPVDVAAEAIEAAVARSRGAPRSFS